MLRHEIKVPLSYFDYIEVRSRLRAVMKPDPHAMNGSYCIRSLYFDTAEDRALKEKENGLCNREKFRIRVYDGDYSFIRLEKKIKRDSLGTKISVSLSREETERIINKDIDWMAVDDRELLRELYIRMRYEGLGPKTIIDYDREPFIYEPGNVRVTLDQRVRTGNYSTDFFAPEAPMSLVEGGILMEIKYDSFLPDIIRDLVQQDCRRAGSYSKYVAGRSFT